MSTMACPDCATNRALADHARSTIKDSSSNCWADWKDFAEFLVAMHFCASIAG
jgi:hypothetical protein